MAFNPKQERNGTLNPGNYTSATPGPSTDLTSTVSGLMSQSQSVAGQRSMEGEQLMNSPIGSGMSGHNVGGGANMWDWDDGLAVYEQPGEWSDVGTTATSSPTNNTPSNVQGTGK